MIGETVGGKYRINTLIAKGFWGSVYQASEIKSGEYAVIKFIDSLADPSMKTIPDQLRAEFQTAAALNSFGLWIVYGYGLHKGVPYVVSAYPDGVVLSGETESAPLAMERVIHICHGIGQLLDTLHNHGIVHGDLRPANVILKPTWDFPHVSLTGFGSTPAQDLSECDEDELVYLAPEQISGKKPDVKTDLYSLGAILYVLATGIVPIRESSGEIGSSTPSQLNAWIPPSLDDLILALLDVDAASRPAKASSVVTRLEQIGQNDLSHPGRPVPPGTL
jgi:serine/threonine protein kinase